MSGLRLVEVRRLVLGEVPCRDRDARLRAAERGLADALGDLSLETFGCVLVKQGTAERPQDVAREDRLARVAVHLGQIGRFPAHAAIAIGHCQAQRDQSAGRGA